MATGHQPEIMVTGLPAGMAEVVGPGAAEAVDHLDLAGRLALFHVCADDLPGHDSAWYRFSPGSEGRGGALVLFCCGDSFLKLRPADSTVLMHREIWEQRPALAAEPGMTVDDFSPERSNMFLHHHLLTVLDLLENRLDRCGIPPSRAEAMTATWAVVIDGRLGRLGLPGYPLTERRGAFSRLFSSAGVLMPDHWQIFQSLWEGGLSSQQEVLGAVRLLPRL